MSAYRLKLDAYCETSSWIHHLDHGATGTAFGLTHPENLLILAVWIWLVPHRNHHGHTSRRSCTLMFVSRDSILRCVINQYRRFWSLNFIVSNRCIPYFVLVNAVHPSHENWHSTAAPHPSGNFTVLHRNNRECSQTSLENSSRESLLASRHRSCSSVRGVCILGEHDHCICLLWRHCFAVVARTNGTFRLADYSCRRCHRTFLFEIIFPSE
jgi:hypothetical protein